MDDTVVVATKSWVVPVCAGVVFGGGGFIAGYIYGKRKGVDEFLLAVQDQWELPAKDEPVDIEQEVDEETEDEPTQEELATFQSIVNEQGYTPKVDYTKPNDISDPSEDEVPTQATVRMSVFDSVETPEWNYDKEIANREQSPEAPYVIHLDEYTRNDMGFAQETLTYYGGDDILCDVSDKIIYNHKQLVGEPLKFGYGSNDPTVVYIRNEKLEREWEIVLHRGLYSVEVGGLEIEEEYEAEDLKHSNTPRKFRREA